MEHEAGKARAGADAQLGLGRFGARAGSKNQGEHQQQQRLEGKENRDDAQSQARRDLGFAMRTNCAEVEGLPRHARMPWPTPRRRVLPKAAA